MDHLSINYIRDHNNIALIDYMEVKSHILDLSNICHQTMHRLMPLLIREFEQGVLPNGETVAVKNLIHQCCMELWINNLRMKHII
jgi:hypothetical protein